MMENEMKIANLGTKAPREDFLVPKVREKCGHLAYIICFYDAVVYHGVPGSYRAI